MLFNDAYESGGVQKLIMYQTVLDSGGVYQFGFCYWSAVYRAPDVSNGAAIIKAISKAKVHTFQIFAIEGIEGIEDIEGKSSKPQEDRSHGRNTQRDQ